MRAQILENRNATIRYWKIIEFEPHLIKSTLGPQYYITLQWRHNGRDGDSKRQPRDCLLKRLFRCRSKKTSKLRVTGLCEGNSPGPVNSPHKGPVTRKMFPFDDVIMINKTHAFCLHGYFVFVHSHSHFQTIWLNETKMPQPPFRPQHSKYVWFV